MSQNGTSGFLSFRVTEDGMTGDRICCGDIVMIEESNEVTAQDIALIQIEQHSHILRRVEKRDDSYILVPSNCLINRTTIDCHDIMILGKVVEVRFAV